MAIRRAVERSQPTPAGENESSEDVAEKPPETVGVSAHLTGATFYRLKGQSMSGPIAYADEYIADLERSPFIQEILEGDASLRLYGYQKDGRKPSFTDFLARFDQFDPPRVPQFAYVVIIRTQKDPKCWYALAFGAGGRYLLKDDLIDVDAHREVARSETIPIDSGEPARLKQVRTRQIGRNTTLIQRRSSRASTLGEINVDMFTEIVDEVDGAPKSKEKFGSALAGGQGLTLRRRITLEDVPLIASNLETSYRDTTANAEGMAGAMFPVKDRALQVRLDDALAAMVVAPAADAEIDFSIPDFIRADDVPEVHFTKLGHGAPKFSDDVQLPAYRSALKDAGLLDRVDVEYLKSAELVIGDEGKGRRFSVYRCLAALVEIDGVSYIHNDRSWYGIPATVLEFIDQQIATIPLWDGVLDAPAARVTEPVYNAQVGRGEFLLLDARLATPVPGQTKIEICDLLTVSQESGRDVISFVHVKRDFSSSSLSHLFEQGRVSAFLLQERTPRARISQRIESALRGRTPKPSWSRRIKGLLGDAGFQARDARVVYAIVGNWGAHTVAQRLPFFSKINLVQSAHLLRGREFDVRVARVQMPGPTYGRRASGRTRRTQ